MNIIELARKAGLRSAVLLDMYKTKEALTPSEELELEQYQTFATDVIKAHEAKLIEGVGEPAVWFDIDTGAARLVKPLRPTYEPCYTATQVAAAVAKANAEIEQLRVQLAGCGVAAMQNTELSKSQRAVKGDYGYSESYADVCRAVDREIEHRERITELESELMEQARVNGMGGEREAALLGKVQRLESTMKLALEALDDERYVSKYTQIVEAINRIKEVLHD